MHPGPLSSEVSARGKYHLPKSAPLAGLSQFQIMNINQKEKKVKHQHLLKSFSKVSTIYESEKKKKIIALKYRTVLVKQLAK